MDTGTKISVAGHTGLILWAMVGGLFNAPSPPPAPRASDVSLISAEEFAALQPPAAAPQVSQTAPRRREVAPPEAAPEAAAREDPAIRPARPEAEPQPTPDAAPEAPLAELAPTPEVAPAPREAPPPPTSSDSATLLPGTALRPREAPRVAPVPAPTPEPDARVADEVRQSVTPDSAAPTETPQERQEASAPEAASTRIITEATETEEDTAEPPAPAAPETSRRPQSRPARPVQTAAPAPEETQEPAQAEPTTPRDPIHDALAEAQETPAPQAPAAAIQGLSRGAALSGAETDGLRRAIGSCWNLGTTSAEAMRTTVVVGVTMKRDGTAEAVRLIDSDGSSAGATDIAFGAARRAILRCVSNANLPAAKYDRWSEIEMVFNPDGMRLR
jgi:outer membrane biosynthesis protein TonB